MIQENDNKIIYECETYDLQPSLKEGRKDNKSKKIFLIVVVFVLLVAIIAISAFLVKNNNENKIDMTSDVTNVHDEDNKKADYSQKEKSTLLFTKESKTTEKEKTTAEKKAVTKVVYVPERNRDSYDLRYQEGKITAIEVRLWGTYLEGIKGSEPIANFYAVYESTSSGEDEIGTYTDYITEGYSYYFDLKTKKGYREEWSGVESMYDESEDIRLLGDGFPEEYKKYDAVEIKYEEDCVVLVLKLDKPLAYKNVDAEFGIYIKENILGTEFGIGNYEFQEEWWIYKE